MQEKILVLDFGGQYNMLIARRVREQHVYAEIRPYNRITPDEIREGGYRGIIFTGGPNSVYDSASPHYDPAILELGIPILGICYGQQLMAWMAGGEIASAESGSEYGKVTVRLSPCALFDGVPERSVCWMSHTDYVKTVPVGFAVTAVTDNCPCAAMADEARALYAVQFHPRCCTTSSSASAAAPGTGAWTISSAPRWRSTVYSLRASGCSARCPAAWIPPWRRCCCTALWGSG